MSSKDQLLLVRIQSSEEKICQLSILHKSRTRERNSSRPQSRSRSQKRFDPKGKYCYFHFRFGTRLQILLQKNYKACRKFRLFVKDRTKNLHFLVDSGADCSIIPATSKNKQPSDYKLFAANGTEIPTYGIKVLKVDLGLRREFLFPFMISKISKGILGADFLHKFNLLLDINKRRLIDGSTQLSIQGDIFSITNDLTVTTLNKCEKFSNLLLQYPELTKPNILPIQVKHDVNIS
ncbi:transposon Ty3-I Gag-Pol polyprotein [Nephila pilipes]|uniref:Transposon Ty3-I Gag-Pol polyprotein n=1 Tax=Nephila pilipes TaxID=299642 RepID=A0A8X6QIR3_NEPPI|nr:transposon Ty3-I Gag-Pol polyprotein [Nephila pilipes]